MLASCGQKLSHSSASQVCDLRAGREQKHVQVTKRPGVLERKNRSCWLVAKIAVPPVWVFREVQEDSWYEMLLQLSWSHQHFLCWFFRYFVFLCRLKLSHPKQKPSEHHFPGWGMSMSMMLLALPTGPTGTDSCLMLSWKHSSSVNLSRLSSWSFWR